VFDEFNNSSLSVKQKQDLIRHYKSDANFLWLLQMSYSPFKVFAQLPKIFDEPKKSPKHAISTLRGAVEYLMMARNFNYSEAEITAELYDFWHRASEDNRKMLKDIIDKNLFGLNCDLINSAVGFNFIPSIQIPAYTRFKKEFFERHKKWNLISHCNGSIVQIFKFGNCVEVFSKNGRPFRIFDKLRYAFFHVPFDGFFNTQIFYLNDQGKEDQKIFFSKTAKKEQSDDFFARVFDYCPLNGSCSSSHSERMEILRFIFNKFVDYDQRISVAPLIKSKNECTSSVLCIADEMAYEDIKPKDFLLIGE